MSNIQKINRALVVLMLAGVAASPARAHFILTAPDSWVDQDMSPLAGGAPQKGGPCGPGSFDDVSPTPTNDKVTPFTVGDTIHVTWQVTVPHDGYFRIALAEDRGDFVDPHFDDATACSYDMSTVQVGPHDNVLMDGIPADAVKQDIVVPNQPCEKCTLQVIQVMKDHGPPNCIYYHCADIKIMPGAGGASDAGLPMGSGGMTGGSGGMTAGGGGMTGGSSGMMGSAGTTSMGSGGMKAVAPSGSGGSAGVALPSGSGGTPAAMMTPVTTPTESSKDDSGCAVAQPGADGTGRAFGFVLGLGVAVLCVRKRRRAA